MCRNVFNHVLTISVNPDGRGGIASVVKVYKNNIYPFKYIASTNAEDSLCNIIIFMVAIFQVILKITFDKSIKIVHIHGASYRSFYRKYLFFFIVKKIFRKKVIYHIHGGKFDLFYDKANKKLRKKIRYFLEGVDLVICLSKEWEEYFLSEFNIQQIEVLNNIIQKPDLSQKRSKKRNSKIKALFLGTIGKQKGTWDILDVIAKYTDELLPCFELLIGGNGDVKKLNDYIRKYDLAKIVKYVGWIQKKDKHEALLASDIYLLPSYHEGLPISILEAMSYRLPIITTNVGGIPQLVKDFENGFLIQPGNQKELIDTIRYFISNRDKLISFGKKSEELVSDFLPKKVIDKLKNIYQDILRKQDH